MSRDFDEQDYSKYIYEDDEDEFIDEDGYYYKPKKGLPGWAITLIVIFAIVIGVPAVAVGLAYTLLYDDGSAKYEPKMQDLNVENYIIEKAVSSIDNINQIGTVYEGNAYMRFTQDEINEIIMWAFNQNVPEGVIGTLDQFNFGLSLNITDNYYDFYASAGYEDIFKTRMMIRTKLDFTKDEQTGEKYFEFAVVEAQIGKLSGFKGIAVEYLPQLMQDNNIDIEKMALESGLHIHFDVETLSIKYMINDLVPDVEQIITDAGLLEGQENADIFVSIMEDIINKELFDVNFNKDKTFEFVFSFKDYHRSRKYGIDPDHDKSPEALAIPYREIADYLAYLYDIDSDLAYEERTELLPLFLIKGMYRKSGQYNNSDMEEYMLDWIQEKGDTWFADKRFGIFPNGIPSIKNYIPEWYDSFFDEDHDGIDTYNNDIIAKTPKLDNIDFLDPSTMSFISKDGEPIVWVNDEDLTQSMHCDNLYGQLYPLSCRRQDDSFKVNYTAIDDFYINIFEGHMYFTVGISVNGYDVTLTVDSAIQAEQPSDGRTFLINMQGIYLGDEIGNESLKDSIFKSMENSINTGSMTKYIDYMLEEGEIGGIHYPANTMIFLIDGEVKNMSDKVRSSCPNDSIADLVCSPIDNLKLKISLEGNNVYDNGTLTFSVDNETVVD